MLAATPSELAARERAIDLAVKEFFVLARPFARATLVPKEVAAMYCAAKAALHSFSKTLRWQLETTGVCVFEILPPLVETAITAGRGKGKISPDQLAEAFWRGFQHNQFEMLAGKTKVLSLIHRLFPIVADRIMRQGL